MRHTIDLSEHSASTDGYAVVAEWLNANGWSEHPVAAHDRHDRQWFKKFPGEPECATNTPKPLQLRVMAWDHRAYGINQIGLEIELHAEPVDDGGWIIIKAHAFDSVEDIPDQVERLFVGWRAICRAA